MAFGDVGGSITELVITCKSPPTGDVNISKGDALRLSGSYEVTDEFLSGRPEVFGQALASSNLNGDAIPVKVRGICIFTYTGIAPVVDGSSGVIMGLSPGTVRSPISVFGNGVGINLNIT